MHGTVQPVRRNKQTIESSPNPPKHRASCGRCCQRVRQRDQARRHSTNRPFKTAGPTQGSSRIGASSFEEPELDMIAPANLRTATTDSAGRGLLTVDCLPCGFPDITHVPRCSSSTAWGVMYRMLCPAAMRRRILSAADADLGHRHAMLAKQGNLLRRGNLGNAGVVGTIELRPRSHDGDRQTGRPPMPPANGGRSSSMSAPSRRNSSPSGCVAG